MAISAFAAGGGAMKAGVASFVFNKWVQLGMRLILGVVFLYAGISKLREPQAFADSIAAFRILPDALIHLVALSLPVLEILLRGMLILGYEVGVAALGCALLLTVFIVALGSALVRGLKVDCGCFGSGEVSTLKIWLGIGRNMLLGIVAWIVMVKALGSLEHFDENRSLK
jgi:hypothetical protein